MLLPSHCSMGIAGLSTSFLFSTCGRISVYPTIKLWPIIGYDRLRYSKSADDTSPHKLDDILVLAGGEGFKLTKIVDGNQQ